MNNNAPNKEEKARPTLRQILDSIKRQYDMVYVARMAGVRLRRRGSTYLVAKCPFHRETSPSFKIKQSNPTYFRCYGCNRSGDIFTFIELYYSLPTINEQVTLLTGRTLYEYSVGLNSEQAKLLAASVEERRMAFLQQKEEEEAKYAPVSDEQASSVYEALIDALDLSGPDCERMKERRLNPEQAYALGYRTLPVPRATRIGLCEQLISGGHTLVKVPGFFRLPNNAKYLAGRWCVAGSVMGWREVLDRTHGLKIPVEGILIPTCNEDGQTIRLKLRNASPPSALPRKIKDLWPEKYIILSSDRADGGANAGVRLHHTGPRDGGRWPNTLWTTEGEIKADIAALTLEARFTGLPGVTQWPELVIRAALNGRYGSLNIAMDQETESDKRQTVAFATEKLCRMAKEAGIDPYVIVWDPACGKGFDDLLVRNGQWHRLAGYDWWRSLTTFEQEYTNARLNQEAAGQIYTAQCISGSTWTYKQKRLSPDEQT